MKILLNLLGILLLLPSLYAQNSVSGRITDDRGDGIFFATVALYSASDSTIVLAESSDNDGYYVLKDLKDGEYYMVASMLGYADNTINTISLPGSNATIDITLSSDAALLSTIEIVDKAPLMEQKADKLVVNVDGNITNTGGSLLDVMKKVPGMIVIRDRLNLAGSGSPTILLNGKSTQYMDCLLYTSDAADE